MPKVKNLGIKPGVTEKLMNRSKELLSVPPLNHLAVPFYHYLRLRSLKRVNVDCEGIFFQIYLPKEESPEKFCYEPAVTTLIFNMLKKNHVFWDIGAARGYYTLLASKVIKEPWNIHAFEPGDFSSKVLKHNLNKFGVKAIVNRYAVAERSDKDTEISGDDYALSLDQLPDMIKMDIEGAEISALKGMRKILSKKHPMLFIEMHPKKIKLMFREDHSFIFDLLSKFGYSIVQIENFRSSNWVTKRITSISEIERIRDNYMLLAYSEEAGKRINQIKQ